MTTSRWIRAFDEGVDRARDEFHAGPAAAFDEKFAAFTVYDTTAAEDASDKPRFMLVPKGRPNEQPLLWKQLHQPFAQIFRNDPDLQELYAGFGTLFTLNRGLEVSLAKPRYLSMSVDAPLDAPGLRHLELTRLQFEGPVDARPLPLTAVCLNDQGDPTFHTTPIIFYWRPPGSDPSAQWGVIPKGMEAWGHVFVSEAIPEDADAGLAHEPDRWGFSGDLRVPEGSDFFSRSILRHRLATYWEGLADSRRRVPQAPEVLERRLAWTVTYFAYACNHNFRRGLISSEHPKNSNRRQILSIVCAPASFASVVNAALYLPLASGPGEPGFHQAALKALYVARSIGMPLERLRWEERGRKRTISTFGHQTSAAFDSIIADFASLPASVLASLGGHLVARLYLLRATIHAYNPRDPHAYDATFHYPWNESDCPLRVYCEIGLQLGFARALRASESEPEVERRGQRAFDELRRPGLPGFSELMAETFDPMTDDCASLHDHAKNEAFAVLLLQVIKQAVYHAIRAQVRGSEKRVAVTLTGPRDGQSLTCTVRNPATPADAIPGGSRDAEEFTELATLFSQRGRYRYEVAGPAPAADPAFWVTTIRQSLRQ